MITRHSAVVGMLETGGNGNSNDGYPKIERYADIDLLHITRVEQDSEPQNRAT
jgi:hypothetical protein